MPDGTLYVKAHKKISTCKSPLMTSLLIGWNFNSNHWALSLNTRENYALRMKTILTGHNYDNNKYVILKTKPIYAAGDIRETTSEKVTNALWFAGRWSEILKPIIKHNDAKLNRSRNYQATNNWMPLFTGTTRLRWNNLPHFFHWSGRYDLLNGRLCLKDFNNPF